MKTQILLSVGLLGVSALTSNAATVALFTGGDVGEGIDFNNVLRAKNIGGDYGGNVGTINFTSYTTADSTASTWTVLNSFGTKPEYGNSDADNALESIMHSIGHGDNQPTVVWSGLAANTMYKVQVLAADNAATTAARGSSYQLITGGLGGTVADSALNISLFNLQTAGGGGKDATGVVITLMGMSDANGILSFRAANSTDFSDSNSIANGIILSAVPEPSTALLGGLGVLALLRRRRA